MSAAYRHLAQLRAGDVVPAELYVLDYRSGARPTWTVFAVDRLPSGVTRLVLVDPDNGRDDVFDLRGCVALTVLTWPAKTLRTQPYPLGEQPGPTLCDFDQQGRADERRAVAHA